MSVNFVILPTFNKIRMPTNLAKNSKHAVPQKSLLVGMALIHVGREPEMM